MLRKPNLLVLDEPTNHLDLEGREALMRALRDYPGTLVFVSHDRHFVAGVGTRVLVLRRDGFEDVAGDYEQYLARLGDDYLAAGIAAPHRARRPGSAPPRAARAATRRARSSAAAASGSRAGSRVSSARLPRSRRSSPRSPPASPTTPTTCAPRSTRSAPTKPASASCRRSSRPRCAPGRPRRRSWKPSRHAPDGSPAPPPRRPGVGVTPCTSHRHAPARPRLITAHRRPPPARDTPHGRRDDLREHPIGPRPPRPRAGTLDCVS